MFVICFSAQSGSIVCILMFCSLNVQHDCVASKLYVCSFNHNMEGKHLYSKELPQDFASVNNIIDKSVSSLADVRLLHYALVSLVPSSTKLWEDLSMQTFSFAFG